MLLGFSRTQRALCAVMIASWFIGTSHAQAQVCGDADGIGGVHVNDAVRVLRAAAALPVECPPRVCDVNGFPGITASDSTSLLRFVAGLDPAPTGCVDPDVTNRVDQVQNSGGTQATMMVGHAPIPPAGAAATIAGDCTPPDPCDQEPHAVTPGAFVGLGFGSAVTTARGTAAATLAPAEVSPFDCPNSTLLVAVPASVCIQDPNQKKCLSDAECPNGTPCAQFGGAVGTCANAEVACTTDTECAENGPCLTFLDGFYALPLSSCDTAAQLAAAQMLVSQLVPAGTTYFVDVASCCNQVMSRYARFKLQAQ